jgi:hypothetical protein
MFVPSAERRREIAEDARRFAQVWRVALDYAEAGQRNTAVALLDAIPQGWSGIWTGHCPSEEREWLLETAVRRIKEIEAEDAAE